MNRIRELRERHQKTQADLARFLNLSQKAISFYELGQRDIPTDVLRKIADYFSVTTDTVLGLSSKPKGVKIPVLGSIVAGIPLEAIEEILDYEEIPEAMAAQGEFFALRVKGRSMEPKYLEGDTVIVKKESCVESGRVAVVLVNNHEATLKQVNISPDGITLIGYNALVYEPKFYTNQQVESMPVRILGEVVELRRKV